MTPSGVLGDGTLAVGTTLHRNPEETFPPMAENAPQPRGRLQGRRAIVAAALLVLLTVPTTVGCYRQDSGEPENETPQTLDYEPAAAPIDGRDGELGLSDDETDLPGEIPPAAGPDDDAGTLGSATDAGATLPVGETDEQVERRGVTAFVGAESRGQYLTEQVAMCVQCHSPKDDAGRVIPERKFQGAPISVVSPYGAQDWAVEAPALAGLASYDRDDLVRLLTEGIARDGAPPKPPMPPFRMSAEDAGAIYDYLSGLPWE